jgi:hypothetical protein
LPAFDRAGPDAEGCMKKLKELLKGTATLVAGIVAVLVFLYALTAFIDGLRCGSAKFLSYFVNDANFLFCACDPNAARDPGCPPEDYESNWP